MTAEASPPTTPPGTRSCAPSRFRFARRRKPDASKSPRKGIAAPIANLQSKAPDLESENPPSANPPMSQHTEPLVLRLPLEQREFQTDLPPGGRFDCRRRAGGVEGNRPAGRSAAWQRVCFGSRRPRVRIPPPRPRAGNRDRGSLTAPPLPHHRAYGSVHGGSTALGCGPASQRGEGDPVEEGIG